jgi:hypothetical protein
VVLFLGLPGTKRSAATYHRASDFHLRHLYRIEVQVLIDHLAYAAPDLATAVADVEERFGVRAQAGGKHIGVGTHNALLALGPRTYLEIIAPDPEQPEPPMPRPLGLDSVTHARLVAWALACDDIDGMVAQARSRGYDPGEISDGLADGLVPFLICWGGTEHPARSAPHGLILESLQIEHPNPPALAPLLTALAADIEVKPAAAPALVAHLSGPNGSKVLR